MGKKDSFNVHDLVFAKVKGYPAWPAKVSCLQLFSFFFVIRYISCLHIPNCNDVSNTHYTYARVISIDNILMMDFALLLLYHTLNHAFACIHFHFSYDIDTKTRETHRKREKKRRRTKFNTENQQQAVRIRIVSPTIYCILCNRMNRNALSH